MLDLNTLAENIRHLRKEELHETQEEFAEHIETSIDTVSNIERARFLPKVETLVKIANYSGKRIDALLGSPRLGGPK